MSLYRVKARWSGFTGSPGYSIFHFDAPVSPNPDGAKAAADSVRAFFGACNTLFPDPVRINIESGVEIIDQMSGQLEDIISVVAPATVAGQALDAYSAAVGACVTWDTGGVRKGRRVRGRTFLVPLSPGNAFAGDGTLSGSAVSTIQAAATTLHGGGFGLGVYARPSIPGATDGDLYSIRGARVADKTAVLRSRRD